MFDELSDDEIGVIFTFLPLSEFSRIILVCKRFYSQFLKIINNVDFWKCKYFRTFRPVCECNPPTTGLVGQKCTICKKEFKLLFLPTCFCLVHWNTCLNTNEHGFIYPFFFGNKVPTTSDEWRDLYMDTRLELCWGLPFEDSDDPSSNFRCRSVLRFERKKVIEMYRKLLFRRLKEYEYFHHQLWAENMTREQKSKCALFLCKEYLFGKFIHATVKYSVKNISAHADLIWNGVTVEACFIRTDVYPEFDSVKGSYKAIFKEKQYRYSVYFNAKGEMENLIEKKLKPQIVVDKTMKSLPKWKK